MDANIKNLLDNLLNEINIYKINNEYYYIPECNAEFIIENCKYKCSKYGNCNNKINLVNELNLLENNKIKNPGYTNIDN